MVSYSETLVRVALTTLNSKHSNTIRRPYHKLRDPGSIPTPGDFLTVPHLSLSQFLSLCTVLPESRTDRENKLQTSSGVNSVDFRSDDG